MNRRTSLKGIAAGAIGLAAFAYFANDWDIFGIETTPSIFTKPQQKTLSSLADTIIPKGNGDIGALDVGTDTFLEKLFEKCYESDIQGSIKTQLTSLNNKAQEKHQKAFAECSQEERETLFLSFSTSEQEEEKEFFELFKSQTIRGFSTTKEVMLDYLKFEIAPGRYSGCIDVNA